MLKETLGKNIITQSGYHCLYFIIKVQFCTSTCIWNLENSEQEYKCINIGQFHSVMVGVFKIFYMDIHDIRI